MTQNHLRINKMKFDWIHGHIYRSIMDEEMDKKNDYDMLRNHD